MGNVCMGDKNKKKKKEEKLLQEHMNSNNNNIENQNVNRMNTPQINQREVNSNLQNNNTTQSNYNTKNQGKENKVNDKNVHKTADKDTNLSKVDYSFAKITKTNNNQFSFEIHGEDISNLNLHLFRENIVNNSKINMSRNELLLLTEENKDILRFLNANNISKQSLMENFGRDNMNGSFALDNKFKIAGNRGNSKLIYFDYII